MSLIERWVQRVLLILAVPLILYAGYVCAQLAWLLITPEAALKNQSEATMVPAKKLDRSSAQGENSVNAQAIAAWHLFGREAPAQSVEKRPKPTIKAPDTTLKLELMGVFVAESDESSTAIIAALNGQGDPQVYAVGDSIAGGATLESVFHDRVLLNRNGRMETLRFSEESTGGLTVSEESAGSAEPSNARGYNQVPEDFNAQADMALTLMGLEPAGPDGGYMVTASAPKEVLGMLPVKVGDRIISVNGSPVGNPGEDQSLFESLLGQEHVQVELQRGPTRLTVDVNVAELMRGR